MDYLPRKSVAVEETHPVILVYETGSHYLSRPFPTAYVILDDPYHLFLVPLSPFCQNFTNNTPQLHLFWQTDKPQVKQKEPR